jgi:hypothetical protein
MNEEGIATKFCGDCRQHVPVWDFYRHRKSPDGLHSYCKTCHKDRATVNQERRRSKRRALGLPVKITPPKDGYLERHIERRQEEVAITHRRGTREPSPEVKEDVVVFIEEKSFLNPFLRKQTKKFNWSVV